MLVLDKVGVVRHQRMKVAPRELYISLFVLCKYEDEGRFYLSFNLYQEFNEQLNSAKVLKGRVTVPGCIQRASDW